MKAEAALATVDPVLFSAAAFERFKGKVVQYIADLYEESIKVSRRYEADSVSASHVEKASEALVAASTPVIARHVGTIGGLVAGIGGSQLASMLASNAFPAVGVLISAVCSAIGFAGIAWHFAKER
ncbi:MAG TPA: hypothetical protein VGQ36_03750 [Thermoanaerobaculia bacterium]|jgi:hypothetical protein|nr:hypothetical protein [Thermoanaerobaculia bacterium]